MSPNPDSVSTKHRAPRAKASTRAARKQPQGAPAVAGQPDGNLLSVDVHRHPQHDELPVREERIRVAAYLLAEQRGFTPGHELEDWLAAETEIDRLTAIALR